ncbi:hydroxymethylglutaryl-CoA reductase, degradative [Lactobacillus sp. S2-2]|uniref:hydroxymethylglutaryl-CoA reductase, degradative n=1 Tax=Lactobacillus sp. S2-2 TaxID=2692917 RepID=UPI001F01902A
MEDLKKFYKKSYLDRKDIVAKKSGLNLHSKEYSAEQDSLIENYLFNFEMPEGIATNLKVNQIEYLIPIVTEEPSVIAALSNGSKMFTNGINAVAENKDLLGQIILNNVDLKQFETWFKFNEARLIKIGNKSQANILKYGDGIKKIKLRKLSDEYVSMDFLIDVGESMGANMVNTILEAISNEIENYNSEITLLSILSNYGEGNVVKANGSIPFENLDSNPEIGKLIAQKIVKASDVAQLDPKRAVTHNKGIMNGIDGIVLATGNDLRAVESSVHAYASKSGQYRGLSNWSIKDNSLYGEIELPLPIGIVGGATKVLEDAQTNLKILKINDAKTLMQVIASVGLAQNVAALKALVTDGIQKGHMSLRLKSLIISVGANNQESEILIRQMQQLTIKEQNTTNAKKLLNNLRNK